MPATAFSEQNKMPGAVASAGAANDYMHRRCGQMAVCVGVALNSGMHRRCGQVAACTSVAAK